MIVVTLCAVANLLALCGERGPPSGVITDPAGLRLELDDPRHPLQECPVVRDGHDTPAVLLDEPFEQLQPVEIEVVCRLVEQQHLCARRRDRFDFAACCLASGASRLGRALFEKGDRQVGRLEADGTAVGSVDSGKDAKQRRLADPVRADEPDPRTG